VDNPIDSIELALVNIDRRIAEIEPDQLLDLYQKLGRFRDHLASWSRYREDPEHAKLPYSWLARERSARTADQ